MVAHWRCGGSLEIWWLIGSLQTSEEVVPGSIPASFTVENSEDRFTVYSYTAYYC